MVRRTLPIVVFAAILLLAGVAAFAQTTAQIVGEASTGGSPLPGVTVTIASPQMQGTRTTVTGEAGGYSFAGIPPGDYSVTFELTGMRTVKKPVKVGVGQTGRADADMRVSEVSEAITVTAAAPTVLETPTASQNISAKVVDNLPVARTVLGAAALAPGVNTNTASGSQLSISGSPGYDNVIMVNGVVITEEVRSQALPLFIEDAIQETTVMTGAISAEYGRFTGGVVNSISKSGGNEFSGSLRDQLSNPTWTSRTPLQITNKAKIRDTTNQVRMETLGGFIVKDRLWFFGAGRQTKADTPNSLRVVPGTTSALQYDTISNEKRYEGKLTGQVTSKHNLTASYLKTDAKTQNSAFTSVAYGPEQLSNRHDPYTLKSANYNGILTNNWLLEGLYSKMFWGVAWGNGAQSTDFVNGTLVRNRADGNARFNSATFCGVCDKETRSNDSWNLKTNYFLSTKSFGNMNFVGGVEQFREHRHSNNYQSGSNFRFFVNSVQMVNGTLYPTVNPGTAASSAFIVWTPIFNLQQGDSNLATNSAFVNDRWDLNDKWSFNIGARFDKNDAVDGTGNKIAKDSKISPRLSATYDVTGNGKHRITGSYSVYASRIVDGPATAASSAGSPGYIYYRYLGPAINPAGTPADQLVDTHAALQIVYNWLQNACDASGKCGVNNLSLVPAVGPRGGGNSVPGYDTVIAGNLNSPYVREMSLSYGAQLTPTIVGRIDAIARDWKSFYAYRVDNTTAQRVDFLGIAHDVALVQNTNDIKRQYRGLQLQTSWHPNRFSAGLNYTYSTLKGNDEQESATSGTVGNSPDSLYYPQVNQYAGRLPIGYLSGDERHRARAWVGYDIPAPRAFGLINLSLLQNFDSGQPYSAVGTIDLSPYVTPLLAGTHYVAAPTAGQYYFGKRGQYRTPNIQSTNLALNWERPIGRFAVFAHLDYLNVFNKHNILPPNINTTVNTAANSSNFAPFNPYTGQVPVECPQGQTGAQCKAMGANFQKSSSFGQASNATSAFQQMRSWSVNLGARF